MPGESFSDADLQGLELCPQCGDRRKFCRCAIGAESKPAAPAPRGMNKWEALFAQHLAQAKSAGEVQWWEFEPFKLRIGRSAYYKPDFAAQYRDGRLVFFEVKGMWREAARVRIKVAADRFPFQFIAVRLGKYGGFDMEAF